MHHKFCIIDSNTLLTGSFNLTQNAKKNSDENLVIIKYSPSSVHKYQQEFERLWNSGLEYLPSPPNTQDTNIPNTQGQVATQDSLGKRSNGGWNRGNRFGAGQKKQVSQGHIRAVSYAKVRRGQQWRFEEEEGEEEEGFDSEEFEYSEESEESKEEVECYPRYQNNQRYGNYWRYGNYQGNRNYQHYGYNQY